jgi:hypothetical protein
VRTAYTSHMRYAPYANKFVTYAQLRSVRAYYAGILSWCALPRLLAATHLPLSCADVARARNRSACNLFIILLQGLHISAPASVTRTSAAAAAAVELPAKDVEAAATK